MDLVHMLLALAGVFAGAGLLFLLLTRNSSARKPGKKLGRNP